MVQTVKIKVQKCKVVLRRFTFVPMIVSANAHAHHVEEFGTILPVGIKCKLCGRWETHTATANAWKYKTRKFKSQLRTYFIGVEQGVPASAKTIPKSIGYKNSEFVEFTGIALITTGISKSNSPVLLSPITIKSDAIISVQYPPNAEANTLPVTAQIIPIIENTIAVPNIKKHN